MTSLPQWKSHKIVQASRIESIFDNTLNCEDGTITVSDEYLSKHSPQTGGFYVRYPDGYESYSPLRAFLEGYIRHPNPGQTRAKFRCVAVNTEEGEVDLEAVVRDGNNAENDAFFRWTPAGHIAMSVLNPNALAAFQPEQEYYVDFTPVPIMRVETMEDLKRDVAVA